MSGRIFLESASCCNPEVSDGVAIAQTCISTRWAFIANTLSIETGWPLEAKVRHRFELLRQGKKLPLPA